MCRQPTVRLWFWYSCHTWVTDLNHVPAVSTLVTGEQSEHCMSVSILCVIYWLNKVYTGCRESQAQQGSKHGCGRLEKVTAEVEDRETRAVYVSSAIHLYLDTLIFTLKTRPCPLPLSLCFCSINKSHSRSWQQPRLFAQCVYTGPWFGFAYELCIGSSRHQIKCNNLRLMSVWQGSEQLTSVT